MRTPCFATLCSRRTRRFRFSLSSSGEIANHRHEWGTSLDPGDCAPTSGAGVAERHLAVEWRAVEVEASGLRNELAATGLERAWPSLLKNSKVLYVYFCGKLKIRYLSHVYESWGQVLCQELMRKEQF